MVQLRRPVAPRAPAGDRERPGADDGPVAGTGQPPPGALVVACPRPPRPSVQAGVLYGSGQQVPAFRWWDKSLGRLVVTQPSAGRGCHRVAAERRERAAGPRWRGHQHHVLRGRPHAAARSELGGRGRRPGAGAVVPPLLRQPVRARACPESQRRRDGRGALPGPAPADTPGRAAGPPPRLVRRAARCDERPAARRQRLARGRAPRAWHAHHLREPRRLRRDRPPCRAVATRVAARARGSRRRARAARAGRGALPRDYRIVVLSDHGQSLGPTFQQVEEPTSPKCAAGWCPCRTSSPWRRRSGSRGGRSTPSSRTCSTPAPRVGRSSSGRTGTSLAATAPHRRSSSSSPRAASPCSGSRANPGE